MLCKIIQKSKKFVFAIVLISIVAFGIHRLWGLYLHAPHFLVLYTAINFLYLGIVSLMIGLTFFTSISAQIKTIIRLKPSNNYLDKTIAISFLIFMALSVEYATRWPTTFKTQLCVDSRSLHEIWLRDEVVRDYFTLKVFPYGVKVISHYLRFKDGLISDANDFYAFLNDLAQAKSELKSYKSSFQSSDQLIPSESEMNLIISGRHPYFQPYLSSLDLYQKSPLLIKKIIRNDLAAFVSILREFGNKIKNSQSIYLEEWTQHNNAKLSFLNNFRELIEFLIINQSQYKIFERKDVFLSFYDHNTGLQFGELWERLEDSFSTLVRCEDRLLEAISSLEQKRFAIGKKQEFARRDDFFKSLGIKPAFHDKSSKRSLDKPYFGRFGQKRTPKKIQKLLKALGSTPAFT